LHNEEQYSTARDTARILAAAMENEMFRTIFGTTHYTVPATNKSEARELSTGNFLMSTDTMRLYYDTRVVGSRTGVTETGFRGIASVAEHNGLRFISIVTGAMSEMAENGYSVKKYGGYDETIELLDLGFHGYKAVQLLYENQVLTQCGVINGDCQLTLGTREAISVVLPSDVSRESLSYRYDNSLVEVEAPIEKDTQLSSVEVWYGNICIAKADLYAMNKVSVLQKQDDLQYVDNEKSSWSVFWICAGIVLAIIIFAVVVVGGVRSARRAAADKRSRRYRKDRRRSR